MSLVIDDPRAPAPGEKEAATFPQDFDENGKREDSEADEFEEAPVRPDGLRLPEEFLKLILGQQIAGQTFEGITAKGASMYGSNNIQVNNSVSKRPTLNPPTGLEDLRSWYVATGTEKEMRRLLESRTSVCLTGGPDTGRLSTAYHVLMERFDADTVMEFQVPLGQSVADAVHEDMDLPSEHGYLIFIGTEDPAPIISRLDARVRLAKSKLILIRDRAGGAKSRDGEVEHVAPDPREVFRAHVRRLAETEEDRAKCSRVLEAAIPLPSMPREVVALVERLLPLPALEVEQFATNHSHAALLAVAGKYLETQDMPGPPGRRRLRQHRRAFRIAYAASVGQPIGQVFTITGLLLSKIDAESGWDDLGRVALEHTAQALLGDWYAQRHNLEHVAKLDRDMIEAVFDVAWHDFDHTRPALIAWLHDLVAVERFRSTAIHAATKLALADFDEAFPELVNTWSRSRKPGVRQAAAQTAMLLSLVPPLRERTLRAVHNWVSATTRAQRDTAASAYASGLRQDNPQWDLADLRSIAADKAHQRSWTIAEAVRQLLRPGLVRLVVSTLADWVRTDEPPRLVTPHAARSLVRMANRPADHRWDSPPMLLAGLADGVVAVHDLGPLWYAALLGDSTRDMAWPALSSWLLRASADMTLRESAAALLNEMARNAPPLRRRLRQFLDRPDTPDWITTLIKEWNR